MEAGLVNEEIQMWMIHGSGKWEDEEENGRWEDGE